MKRLSMFVFAAALSACVAPAQSDEIATGEWQLIGLEGQPVAFTATIAFAPDGKVAGQAPCNRYFGA
ncbi:MAG: META domain-containing protein, partial [Tabrizicola sp.]